MPNKTELQKLREQILTEPNIETRLFFILKIGKNFGHEDFEVKDVRINQSILDEFQSNVVDNLGNLLESNELIFQKYDPTFSDSSNPVIEYVNRGDMPPVFESWISKMDEHLEYIGTTDNSFIKTVWAYTVRLKFNNIQIIYFRKYSGTKILSKGKGFLNLVFEGGYFKELTHDVLEFDNRIDAIFKDEEIIILHKNQFEKLFSFYKHYESKALTILRETKIENLLSDNKVSDLVDICKADPRKLKKLISISNRPIDLEKIGYDRLKEFSQHWKLDLAFDDKTCKISTDWKQDRNKVWTLLKLLNDDYLSSTLTNEQYEVQSKTIL